MAVPTYNADQVISQCISSAKEKKIVKAGQKIAILHGSNEETPDESDIMKILDAWAAPSSSIPHRLYLNEKYESAKQQIYQNEYVFSHIFEAI